MKYSVRPATLLVAIVLATSCESKKNDPQQAEPLIPIESAESDTEIPILPLTKGDHWVYNVNLQIPPDVTSAGASEIDTNHPLTRTYIGKIVPAEGLPEVDCFEVTGPSLPVEREFVDIHPDRVLIRGSMLMRPETTHPMWLDHPVPFVFAGMKAGTELPEVQTKSGSLSRKTQVIARESVTVPAGTYPSIRLLMSGMDGELELKRTIWFAPRVGIVREEKVRYRLGKLVFRETHELTKTSVALKNSSNP